MTEVRSVLLALLYRFSREILFMELCLLFYCLLFGKSIRFSPDRGVHNKKEARYAKRQVAVALKQAGLSHAHEDGVTLYIQWLCLFRCYRKMGKNRKQVNL
ncbi:MAG: hypothetical protein HDR28_07710 [Lachnospiraceae bacterium]|nr:hypothetical protein [Lachnospiraceae bacterium]